MPSPFPGMNPWLEQDALWHEFHQAFLTGMRDAIAQEVAPRYYVALEEHVYIHEPPEPVARFLGRPDSPLCGRVEPVQLPPPPSWRLQSTQPFPNLSMSCASRSLRFETPRINISSRCWNS